MRWTSVINDDMNNYQIEMNRRLEYCFDHLSPTQFNAKNVTAQNLNVVKTYAGVSVVYIQPTSAGIPTDGTAIWVKTV